MVSMRQEKSFQPIAQFGRMQLLPFAPNISFSSRHTRVEIELPRQLGKLMDVPTCEFPGRLRARESSPTHTYQRQLVSRVRFRLVWNHLPAVALVALNLILVDTVFLVGVVSLLASTCGKSLQAIEKEAARVRIRIPMLCQLRWV